MGEIRLLNCWKYWHSLSRRHRRKATSATKWGKCHVAVLHTLPSHGGPCLPPLALSPTLSQWSARSLGPPPAPVCSIPMFHHQTTLICLMRLRVSGILSAHLCFSILVQPSAPFTRRITMASFSNYLHTHS